MLGVGGGVPSVGSTVGFGPVPPPSACFTAFIRGYLKQHNNGLQFTLRATLKCIVRFILFSIGKKMAAVHFTTIPRAVVSQLVRWSPE